MRVCSLFPALHLYPSDTTREHPRRAGIEGLRHKLRHKIGATFREHPISKPRVPLRSLSFSRACVCKVSVQPSPAGLPKQLLIAEHFGGGAVWL